MCTVAGRFLNGVCGRGEGRGGGDLLALKKVVRGRVAHIDQ